MVGSGLARHRRGQSWDSLHPSNASDGSDGRESPAALPGVEAPNMEDLRQLLHPLRSVADRVGRQAEEFAESLDRMNKSSRGKSSRDCRYVLPLVCEYERIASETVQRLKRTHESERQEKLQLAWTRKLRKLPEADDVADQDTHHADLRETTNVQNLFDWEQERQTWQLLRLLLQVEKPAPSDAISVPDAKQIAQPAAQTPLHRYASDAEAWAAVLGRDKVAWEQYVILKWLKQCADEEDLPIDTLVDVLDGGDSGNATSSGPPALYTRETIKAEKRMRSVPHALEPSTQGLDRSLTPLSTQRQLVTQLDPDAVSRQARHLESQDLPSNQLTWVICWEMLRRGRSWTEIREWCNERQAGWAALSVSPFLVASVGNAGAATHDAAWRTRHLWRRACSVEARKGLTNEWESAMYSVLSGDDTAFPKDLASWPNQVFASYTAKLLARFELVLQTHFPDLANIDSPNGGAPAGLDKTQDPSSTSRDFQGQLKPYQVLQNSLINHSFADLVIEQGLDKETSGSSSQTKVSLFLANAQDNAASSSQYDLLRVVAHMVIIFRQIEGFALDVTACENIIFAYVNFLGRAGKQQLLPLYAHYLSDATATECMAQQLALVTDSAERTMLVRLMQQYNLKIRSILQRHWERAMVMDCHSSGVERPDVAINMLDTAGPKVYGLSPVRSGFMSDDNTSTALALIHAVEWFLFVDSEWHASITAIVASYQHFLNTQQLGAARELYARVSFAKLSVCKTAAMLGETVDLSLEPLTVATDAELESDGDQMTNGHGGAYGAARSQRVRQYLLRSARELRELESLVGAMVAIDEWQSIAAQAQIRDARASKSWRRDLQLQHDKVIQAMEPLLSTSGFGAHGEGSISPSLVDRYLPEIILAYLSVLNVGGHMLSREELLRCLEVAVQIARSDSTLSPAFAAAKRTPELCDALAAVSVGIVKAGEAGRSRSSGRKRSRSRHGLDIFKVKAARTA